MVLPSSASVLSGMTAVEHDATATTGSHSDTPAPALETVAESPHSSDAEGAAESSTRPSTLHRIGHLFDRNGKEKSNKKKEESKKKKEEDKKKKDKMPRPGAVYALMHSSLESNSYPDLLL
ncbi:hypothetical protein GGI15_000566 [Coemansia interrupta]|uniref:Uncharacterized protein n=1 Tax=Coemansia interrupta TaxID=1126814 RepID=A0A9W8HMW9_9FUNG|nr:hypothetical protein GGI15_000566 [Coemansia interrupta]